MKVIITGATGMVGEGVLLECLSDARVTEVLSVSRRPTGRTHPKLSEYIVSDFTKLIAGDPRLQGYDACFFCAGVSSVGMKEADYTRVTYVTTLAFANALEPKPNMTFIYVSGLGTDSSEKGRSMWARVKGKTENDLMRLSFAQVFAFRPSIMTATEGMRNVLPAYRYVSWLFPLVKVIAANYITTMQQVGQAMINATEQGYEKRVIEVKDIKALAPTKV